jgi:HSP20 family protein
MKNDKEPNKKDRDENRIDNFDDFFNHPFNQTPQDIFEMFEKQIRHMQKQMNAFYQNNTDQNQYEYNTGKPRIYGWSYHVGPDGQPHFKKFSNMKEPQEQSMPQITQETKEPYVDVIDSDKEIYITVEIPGVEKENIDVELNKNTLLLNVKDPERGFKKEVKLPTEVRKKPEEAKYNNGILSLTLQKRKKNNKGHKIHID